MKAPLALPCLDILMNSSIWQFVDQAEDLVSKGSTILVCWDEGVRKEDVRTCPYVRVVCKHGSEVGPFRVISVHGPAFA